MNKRVRVSVYISVNSDEKYLPGNLYFPGIQNEFEFDMPIEMFSGDAFSKMVVARMKETEREFDASAEKIKKEAEANKDNEE